MRLTVWPWYWVWYVLRVVWGGARISLLTDFEDAISYLDWTIGTHGIQISFTPPPTSPSASDAPSPLSSAISLLSRPLTSLSSSPSSPSSHSSSILPFPPPLPTFPPPYLPKSPPT